ncbi:hypothetical protein GC174_10880 [bacterium]|nr:hypothetical protein [bacterium]
MSEVFILNAAVFSTLVLAFVVFTVRTKSERGRAFILGNFGTLFNASSGQLDRESFFAPLKKPGLWAPALVSAFCLYVGGITYLFALSKSDRLLCHCHNRVLSSRHVYIRAFDFERIIQPDQAAGPAAYNRRLDPGRIDPGALKAIY